MLALQIHPSPSRPHHLAREGPSCVYVRVGSTNRRADAELIEELRRFARGEGFDEQPIPGVDSEALDFRAASESFASFSTLARRDLETLRIQAGRFDGTDKSRIVDRAEIRTLPVSAIEEAIAFVHKHALHGAEIGTGLQDPQRRYFLADRERA